ncbi:hypothetical protein RO21_05590 [[Actinobacillus] muris]|uniref:Uncharacterized protein n=1 Tax=Muribacter muris TaxID=67855 RepID=A0A0J5P715_9PAST|nr:hypothetical protein [Muribacter muris]KMK51570.1 hypothetical protein RO21_05590 [[Actinobacillus] muris] [Muribacter muris]
MILFFHIILNLLMQSVPTHLSFPLLEQLLAQQQQKLQTLFQTLSEDDEQGRQYIQQMIDSVAQAQHCRQLAQQVVDTHR